MIHTPNATTINCFLISGFTGKLRANKDRVTGCVRAVSPAPAPHGKPSGPEADQNNTVAAFMIARGESAMLELPVAGAYEAMDMYNVDAAVLQLDFGAAKAAGTESAGVYTREYEKGTVQLDCKEWKGTITMKK